LCCKCVFDRMESDDLLEVCEHAIARSGMREISERSVSARVSLDGFCTSRGILTAKTR
jgi:hypothetical protein